MMICRNGLSLAKPGAPHGNKRGPVPVGGFTLIELLIVVAIIGILAAIAIPNFLAAQVRAKVAMAQSHMRTIEIGLESFRVDHDRYPPHWDAVGVYHYIQDPPDPLWSYGFGIPSGFPQATLTTPIDYITQESLVDPFIIDRQGKVPGAWQYGTESGASNAWVLESVGPNGGGEWQIDDNPAFLDKPNAGGNDAFSFINLYNTLGLAETVKLFQYGCGTPDCPGAYDPSNGTVSDGDIVRFSGGMAF